MKNLIGLFAVVMVIINCGFSQNSASPQFTKETAIATLRANYLFMYFKSTEDTTANINRFIDDVNKIVPVDNGKRNVLRTQILAAIRQATEKIVPRDMMFYLNYEVQA